ncbi:hypothetical protein GCHA_1661 [Paraglaciecola chathamensis S18K6]|uniref:Uncharacterized protein n=1 Tax=Paraglaciecola chathamensis S18K6 TaxID=1127672 RepID=A0AAV3UWZ2_9ALTE|nr:hypothetical protein GCHA_1661 [Paraglaciecola chathamensis S18K6]
MRFAYLWSAATTACALLSRMRDFFLTGLQNVGANLKVRMEYSEL